MYPARVLKIVAATFIIALALLGASFADLGKTAPRAVVLDIGQGDAIYLRTPSGQDVLVDAGPANGHVVDRLRQEMPPGDNDLELVVSTHLDADHSGGMVNILAAFDVRMIATNGAAPTTKTGQTFFQAIKDEHLDPVVLHRGQRLTSAGLVADVLWPVGDFTATSTNDLGVVLKITTAHGCILLSADISEKVEQQLLDRGTKLQCDNLKVGHHGSKTSSSTAFLVAVKPRQAIISVGAKNSYGHPTKEALDRLKQIGTAIHRTDQEGSVTVPL